jgi:hypothetical protein
MNDGLTEHKLIVDSTLSAEIRTELLPCRAPHQLPRPDFHVQHSTSLLTYNPVLLTTVSLILPRERGGITTANATTSRYVDPELNVIQDALSRLTDI